MNNNNISTQLIELQRATIASKRSFLFNLILYSTDPRRTAYFQDIIRIITSKFPCRIIFIWKKENTKNGLAIYSSKEIEDCITIEVSEKEIEKVPYIIFPQLVPDIPLYLLWGQDPTTEKMILPYLKSYATKLIFDVEEKENLQQFCKNILERKDKVPIDVTDINWARINGWRNVLAQTFDNEERINQLSSSKTIKIVYNNRASDIALSPETQAVYLQTWIATQLQWSFQKIEKDEKDLVLHYKNIDNPIEVRLHGELSNVLPAEEILEFEATDQSSFLYSFTRKGQNQVIVHCNTMDRCELPFTLFLPNILTPRILMQEIFYKKTSDQYYRMLREMSRINWI